MAKERKPRFQNYTWLIYPESAAKDYLQICKDFHVPMYLSEHNKDVMLDKATGEITPDKVHIHVVTMFSTLQGVDCLNDLIARVGGVKPPLYDFIVRDKRTIARYLSHMDEDPKEKYPYYLDPDHHVISIGGAEDYYELCRGAEETKRAELNMVVDIQDYCERREITNVATLLRILRDHENYEWIDALRKNSYFWAWWFRSYKDEKETPLGPVSRKIEYLRNQKNKEEKNDGNESSQ